MLEQTESNRQTVGIKEEIGVALADAGYGTQRFYFVALAEVQKVLDACPDAQCRLLFALSRYGVLRCPLEHLGLRWGDVDWERGRMLIRSPKTAHHVGHELRLVPLFPELIPYLREVFERQSRARHGVCYHTLS